MSLILGVSKGEKLHLNSMILDVLETAEDKKHIFIRMAGKEFLLNDREFVEIYPQVYAAVGKAKADKTGTGVNTLPRLAIDAPRNIRIERERNRTYGRTY